MSIWQELARIQELNLSTYNVSNVITEAVKEITDAYTRKYQTHGDNDASIKSDDCVNILGEMVCFK